MLFSFPVHWVAPKFFLNPWLFCFIAEKKSKSLQDWCPSWRVVITPLYPRRDPRGYPPALKWVWGRGQAWTKSTWGVSVMKKVLSLTTGVDGLFLWKPETHQGSSRTVTAPFSSLITLLFPGWSVNWISKTDQAVTSSPYLPRFLEQLKLATVSSSFSFKSMWKYKARWEGLSLQ